MPTASLKPASLVRLPGDIAKDRVRKTFTIPSADDQKALQGFFAVATRAWGACVRSDRSTGLQGHSLSTTLGVEFPYVWRKNREAPLINAVVRTYRNRRNKSLHPLRFKSEKSLRDTIPFIPSLMGHMLKGQIHGSNVVHAKVRRDKHGHFTICATIRIPKVERDLEAGVSRTYKKTTVIEVGLAPAPDGLHMLVYQWPKGWITPGWLNEGWCDKRGHSYDATKAPKEENPLRELVFPHEEFTMPGFPQVLHQQLLAMHVNTMSLDLSMLPKMSGASAEASRRLDHWLKSRQAVGANVIRRVSTVTADARKAEKGALHIGQPAKYAKIHRRIRYLKCPACGGWVPMKLDAHTQVPTEGPVRCNSCHLSMSVGLLLAHRALALGLEAWDANRFFGIQKSLDRRKMARKETKAIITAKTTTTKRRRAISPPAVVTPRRGYKQGKLGDLSPVQASFWDHQQVKETTQTPRSPASRGRGNGSVTPQPRVQVKRHKDGTLSATASHAAPLTAIVTLSQGIHGQSHVGGRIPCTGWDPDLASSEGKHSNTAKPKRFGQLHSRGPVSA